MALSDYRIVPIDESHIRGFHASLDEVAREHRYLAFLEAPPFADAEAFVRENIAKHHPQFVALVEDRVVGWCDATPMQRPVFAHRAVLGMGIVAAFRGRGIGRALIETTLAATKARGIERVDLEVREDNLPAIALYRAVGFVVEGSSKRAFRVDGHYFDLLAMGLLFATSS